MFIGCYKYMYITVCKLEIQVCISKFKTKGKQPPQRTILCHNLRRFWYFHLSRKANLHEVHAVIHQILE